VEVVPWLVDLCRTAVPPPRPLPLAACGLGTAVGPGPTHLALYELEGTLEILTADLGRAMQAGVISVPDWFTRFASLEAIAVGERAIG
jgi:hypothetical protein